MTDILTQLEEKRAAARLGGGQRRLDAQHAKGKLTARERLNVLLDEGSFEEWDMFVEHRCHDFGMEDNKIPGVPSAFQDFAVLGVSVRNACRKICRPWGKRSGWHPIIGNILVVRIGKVASLGLAVFQRNVRLGVVPQISLIMGHVLRGCLFLPLLTSSLWSKARPRVRDRPRW